MKPPPERAPEKGCAGDSRAGEQQATREGLAARRETKGRRVTTTSCESREDDGVYDSLGGGGSVLNRGRRSQHKATRTMRPRRRTGFLPGRFAKNKISKDNCGRLFAKFFHFHPYPSDAHSKVLIEVSKVYVG